MLRTKSKQHPMIYILVIYLMCYVFRAIEYMLIRTDRSIIGEAFIHKLLGIVVLAVTIHLIRYKWSDIGFKKQVAAKQILWGLGLGAITFIIAYGSEFLVQLLQEDHPELKYYVSSYSVTGNNEISTGIGFLLICIAGNVINVIMEEGIFRGLIIKMTEEKSTYVKALIISSLLFGLWHIAAPFREFFDGNSQLVPTLIASAMQIILTGLMGIKMCLLVKITGSLWTAMADHFVNNLIVNVLHLVTATGADELQVIRISIAQSVSFIIVLIIFFITKSSRKPTFR